MRSGTPLAHSSTVLRLRGLLIHRWSRSAPGRSQSDKDRGIPRQTLRRLHIMVATDSIARTDRAGPVSDRHHAVHHSRPPGRSLGSLVGLELPGGMVGRFLRPAGVGVGRRVYRYWRVWPRGQTGRPGRGSRTSFHSVLTSAAPGYTLHALVSSPFSLPVRVLKASPIPTLFSEGESPHDLLGKRDLRQFDGPRAHFVVETTAAPVYGIVLHKGCRSHPTAGHPG